MMARKIGSIREALLLATLVAMLRSLGEAKSVASEAQSTNTTATKASEAVAASQNTTTTSNSSSTKQLARGAALQFPFGGTLAGNTRLCDTVGYMSYVDGPSTFSAQTDDVCANQVVACNIRNPPQNQCSRSNAQCQWSPRCSTTICCIPDPSYQAAGFPQQMRQDAGFPTNQLPFGSAPRDQYPMGSQPVYQPNQPFGSGQFYQSVDFFPPAPPPLDRFTAVYLPMPDPYKAPVREPIITPLLLGDIEIRPQPGSYRFPSTVVWVKDTKDRVSDICDIIVDTGLPIDKNTIIGGLAAHSRRPNDMEYVLMTHGHPDHVGNQNLFPNARMFFGYMEILREVFTDATASFSTSSRQLCDNTAIYITPGHSTSDLTLVVRNVEGFGTVALTGDLFESEKDLTQPELWQQFSFDRRMQETNRNMIMCLADYIIPGHGKTFQVTAQMKQRANC